VVRVWGWIGLISQGTRRRSSLFKEIGSEAVVWAQIGSQSLGLLLLCKRRSKVTRLEAGATARILSA
jgi:hypothetical protein